MEAAENGPFDVLLNNSGINVEEEDVIDSPVIMSVLRRTLEVNLIGTIDFCERIVPYVRDDGHIISIGSRMGTLNETELSSAPSYSISKAALGMYTVRLASRLRPRGITVSILNPGWTQTDMGGPDAVRTPDQPAGEIFELATTSVPSGRFWKGGKQQAW
jgi:NAD(P)-dependent dehydrogenase (short-subunit alcohol dehydrogenase family)